MNENPYAPPSARVDDVTQSGAPRVRPPQILLAIQLAAANYVLGLIVIALSWDYYTRLQTPVTFMLGQLLGLAIAVWFYYKIWQGRNWARIVMLVLSVIGMLFSISGVVRQAMALMPAIVKVQVGIGTLLGLIILYLLFISPGKTWFEKQ